MVQLSIQGGKKLNRRIKRIMKTYPQEVVEGTTERLAYAGQKRAREVAPIYRGALRQSIHARKIRDGHMVFTNIKYGVRVHEGGHPDPSVRFSDIRDWVRRRGIDERFTGAIVHQLRREGVKRPTPFFNEALKHITRRNVFRKAVNGSVSTYNQKHRKLLKGIV